MTTQYLEASFRGAVFLVEANSDEGGARSIIHEFPGRNQVYAEPSGKYPRRFELQCHLIGSDFERQMRALEEALDEDGPGKLIHPHRGAVYCAVDGPYRFQRTTRELGMVRLSVTFIEAGPEIEPRVTIDASSAVKASAVSALSKLRAAPPFDVTGPDFLSRAATIILTGPRGVTAAISKVNNRIHAAFGIVDSLSRTIVQFGNEVGSLLATPTALALSLQNLLNSVFTAATAAGSDINRGDGFRNRARVSAVLSHLSALGTFGDGLAAAPTVTSTQEQQAANQSALVDLIETAAVVGAVVTLVDIPLDNTDQAGNAFELIGDLFNRLEDRGTLDDASSQALRDLRAAFHRHLRSSVADLTGLGRYTPPVTVPALVLAYRLYGDSSRDEELLERNPSIEHPGFIAGGVELAVAEA